MSDYNSLSDDEKMENIRKNIAPLQKLFEDIMRPKTKEVELSAIWLEKPVIYKNDIKRWSCRMTTGDEIIVIDGNIVGRRLSDKPTHKVAGVYGTIDSSKLHALVLNLQTNQPEILNLK